MDFFLTRHVYKYMLSIYTNILAATCPLNGQGPRAPGPLGPLRPPPGHGLPPSLGPHWDPLSDEAPAKAGPQI